MSAASKCSAVEQNVVVHGRRWLQVMACNVGFMKMLECHAKKCSKEACCSTDARRQTAIMKVKILEARKATTRIEIGIRSKSRCIGGGVTHTYK